LFGKHGIPATFFVPGEVTQNHADMLKTIFLKGHEIACHGLNHDKNECLLDEVAQRRNIEYATMLIHEKAGVRPKGFRAPCLRINEITFRILDDLGYVYDSSILPTYIPGYYGHPSARSKPYYLFNGSNDELNSSKLLEIPVSVNPAVPLPLSAAWMRNLGLSWVKLGVKMNFAFGNPVVFYVHPRDVVTLPRMKGIPWHLYKNTGFQMVAMLDKLIGYAKSLNTRFVKARDFAKLNLAAES
jgi:peptidoglycan/xylan/chitin deacetylase (PgdA/CDA1 family)